MREEKVRASGKVKKGGRLKGKKIRKVAEKERSGRRTTKKRCSEMKDERRIRTKKIIVRTENERRRWKKRRKTEVREKRM